MLDSDATTSPSGSCATSVSVTRSRAQALATQRGHRDRERIPGERFRAISALCLLRGSAPNRSSLARLLRQRLARRGIRYHERTLRRQLAGAVDTVPREVVAEMSELACEVLGLANDEALDAALEVAGMASETPDAPYVPAARIVDLARLWLFYNPDTSRRSLAAELSTRLAHAGVKLGVDPLQVALAGQQRRARREVLFELLDLLRPHGVEGEDDGRRRFRELEARIERHERDRDLVSPERVLELARAWKLHHQEPSSRRLGKLLRRRLSERSIAITTHRAQQIIDGRTKSVRRACVEVLEELVAEGLPPDTPVEEAVAKAARKPVRQLDLCWVHADGVASLAQEWLAEHPQQTRRQLALRVAKTARRMGYATSHNTIQPILGGHKKRCRGFVYRALLKQFQDKSQRIPVEEVVPSTWSRHLLSPPSETQQGSPTRSRSATQEEKRDRRRDTAVRPASLSRDDEAGLAEAILLAERDILDILLRRPGARGAFAGLLEALERGDLAAWDIVVDGRPPSDHGEQKQARETTIRALRSVVEGSGVDGARALSTIRLGHRHLRRITDELGDRSAPSLTSAWRRLDAARAELIAGNMHVVYAQAARFHSSSMERGDLVQEGCIGLMRAVDKFDHRRGIKFSTYANWWVRQAVQRALSDQGRVIRLPVHIVQDAHSLRQARRRFMNQRGRAPTDAELASLIGVDEAKVATLGDLPQEPVSMSAPVHDDGDGATLGDRVADPIEERPLDEALSTELRALVRHAVAELPERQAWALRSYYGIDSNREHTLAELGRQLGLTRERIRQIKASGAQTIRNRYGARLRELLEPGS